MRYFFFFIFFIPNLAFANDWGSAHNLLLFKKLTNSFTLESRSLFLTRNNLSDTFFIAGDFGVSYRFNPHLKLGVAYRQAAIKFDDRFNHERRPILNLDLSAKPNNFKLNNRVRLEFRFFNNDRSDDLRLRNEIRVISSRKVLFFNPYLEEEFFYSFRDGEFEMNWLSAGIRFDLTSSLKAKLGYRWNSRKVGGDWRGTNQIVTGLFLFL